MTSLTTAPAPPSSARDLITAARRLLLEAATSPSAPQRYIASHAAALRAAAAVLAVRAHPAHVRRGPSGVWTLLASTTPELTEWAEFFTATAALRSALEVGATTCTDRVADDLLRDADHFCGVVADLLRQSGPRQTGPRQVGSLHHAR